MPKQTESVVIDVAETTVAQPEASCASQLPNTAPEKQLNLFVRVVASVERAGNALGTLAFTWATVVLLGGYPTSVNFEDFVFATTLFFLEAARMFSPNRSEYQLFFRTWGAFRPFSWNRAIVVICLDDVSEYLRSNQRREFHSLVVSMLMLVAATMPIPGVHKLKSGPLHNAILLWSPLVVMLLLVPSIVCKQTAVAHKGNCLIARTFYMISLVTVLLLIISKLQFPSITRIVHRPVIHKLQSCHQVILVFCMCLAAVPLVFFSPNLILMIVLTLLTTVCGSLQIPAAVIRVEIALMRLLPQDYCSEGDPANDSGKINLKPTLNVFYGMVLGQGILYLAARILEFFSFFPRRSLARRGGFRGQKGVQSVDMYYEYAFEKCMNTSILAPKKMNLTTFAMDSLKSGSRKEQFCGVRILYSLVCREPYDKPVLSKVTNSRKTVTTLIQMLGWENPEDNQIRLLAAKITAELANGLRIVAISGAMNFISSLLDNHNKQQIHELTIQTDSGDEENCWVLKRWRQMIKQWSILEEEQWAESDILPALGLVILERLATYDLVNCVEISRSMDIIPKITGFTSNNGEKMCVNETGQKVLIEFSLRVLRILASIGGETGITLRHKISEDPFLLDNLAEILEDSRSNQDQELREMTIDILTKLAMDESTRKEIGSIQDLARMLQDNRYIYVAANVLQNLCKHSRVELRDSDVLELFSVLPEVLGRVMDADGKELEVLVGLSSQICSVSPESFTKAFKQGQNEEIFVEKLINALNANSKPNAQFPGIRRVIIEQLTYMMELNSRYATYFRNHGLMEALIRVEKTPSKTEKYRLFLGKAGLMEHKTARRRRSHMENTINGEHIVQIRGVQAEGKMAAPEKRLNRFVHLVAMTERLGNALGAMAFTWATVVLLGGYPDNLDSTDFWLATAIVFLEAIRMFTNDNRLDYQLFFGTRGDFRLLGWNGLLVVMVYLSVVPVLLSKKLLPWRQLVLNMCMLAAIVMLVFIFSDELTYQLMIIVYEVSALLFLSSGNFQIPAAVVRVVLALTQLLNGNDGENDNEQNLKTSLDIFYGMVLGQGILYIVACLVEAFSFIPRRYLIHRGGFGGQMGVEYANSYYAYAFEKCMGGAVLAPKKISLITFAMDSLNSDSSRKKLYGAQMLHKFLKKEQLRTKTITKLTNDTRTVVSLFDMLDWKSDGDEQIRLFAAKITAELAGSLRVVQIPGATQLVASLVLDTDHQQTTRDHFLFIDSQVGREDSPIQQVGMGQQNSPVLKYLKQVARYCLIPVDEPSNRRQQNSSMLRWWKRITKRWSIPEEEPSRDQDFLPVQGLLILERLANFDPGNCMEISRTIGLISKMIDFTSYRNHMTSTNEAHQIMLASLSLRVLRRLASTEGKLGVTLRQQILEHPFVLSNLSEILNDSGSNHEQKQLAAEILKNLAMDRNTSKDIEHIRVIISSLMCRFLSRDPSSSTNCNHLLRKTAGQALAMLAMESKDNCLVMLMEPGYAFIRELTATIHNDRYKCITASLLWSMCEHAQCKLSNSDLKGLSDILRLVLEGIMHTKGAELEVLIGLSSQICKCIPEDFARELEKGQIKERFVKRLVDELNAHMRPSPYCPSIRRVIVQHAIYLMEFNPRYANDFHKCWMVEALSKVESTPSRVENYRLLSGDMGLMEHSTAVSTLVARAKKLMGRDSLPAEGRPCSPDSGSHDLLAGGSGHPEARAGLAHEAHRQCRVFQHRARFGEMSNTVLHGSLKPLRPAATASSKSSILAMANATGGEHSVQIRAGEQVEAAGKMATPEKWLNRFVRVVALMERTGNALGTLAFTWATVILLGGYPTVLDSKKDYRFITVIVFLEATRMFTRDNRLDYQLFFRSRGAFRLLGWNGLLIVIVYFSAMLMLSSKHGDDFFSVSLPVVIVAIVMLVFTFSEELPGRLVIIVYDVSALLLLSFGNFQIPAAAVRVVLASLGLHKKNGENSEKNLKASLIIFYGMVLGQGILYIVACLLEVFSFIPRKYLIRHGGLGGQMGVEYVNLYYAYAFEKCMGGAVLAPKKISLITFAMDSLNSDSSRKKLYGVQMLHKFLKKEQLRTKTITKLTNDTRTVVSLFDMLDWTSNGDEEIRLFAAKVTAELAGSLRVVQIPGATQLVASLLDTDHQQTTRDHFLCWKQITKCWSVPEEEPSTDQDFLPVQGLIILERLANFDLGNCMEISRTGLISKMIDFTSYRNHMISTNEAHQIMLASLSLRVLRRLASTEGKLGVTLRQQILDHTFILSNLAEIMDDNGSSHELKQLAAEILKNLAMDRNTSEDIGHIRTRDRKTANLSVNCNTGLLEGEPTCSFHIVFQILTSIHICALNIDSIPWRTPPVGSTASRYKVSRSIEAGKMATPEKWLNRFVRLLALMERMGNALGTLAFTWATVVLLGGYPTVLGSHDDFWYATAIVFLEAFRMFTRDNRLDYQLLFRSTGALRLLGWNGMLIVIVYFSAMLMLSTNYGSDENGDKFFTVSLPGVIVGMALLVATGKMLSGAALKLLCNPLRRAISLWSPLFAILLLGVCIGVQRDHGSKNTKTSRTLLCLYLVLFSFVLLPTISRLRFPCIVKLVGNVLCRKLLPWRQVILNMCMLAAIVMLVFIFSEELSAQLLIIVYEVSALLLLSFGNFQIPAAAVRVVLALVGILHLHQKDKANKEGIDKPDNEKNLKASLIIFYGMVLGQGIVYIVACLLEVFSFIPRKYLIRHGGLGGQMGVEYVNLYYAYAFEKCMGGAVLAPKKISLITFAMDSLNSDSSRKKLYGVQMLHKFLKKEQLRTKTITKLTNDTKTVASLFDMLDWTSDGDEEIRLFAAKVTAELAGSLRVVQIPGATQLVASLLDTHHQLTTRDHFLFIDSQVGREDSPNQPVGLGEQNSPVLKYLKQMAIYCLIPVDEPSNVDERNSSMLKCWKRITKCWSVPEEEEPSTDQDFLPVQGLLILERLANFDPGIFMEVSRTTGLISKMIDFTSCRNHMTSTNEAHQIMLASLSLRVLRRLASTEGKLGVTLRQQILEHPFLLSNLAEIMDDNGSSHELQQLAAEILKNLAMDRNTREDIGHIRVIISSLMRAFVSRDPSSSTDSNHLLWKTAGQALAVLAIESTDNCLVMLMEPGYVLIRELTTMIHDDRYKCIAASLLWNMCEHAQPELSKSDLKELSYILREGELTSSLHIVFQRLTSIHICVLNIDSTVLERIMDAEGAELEVLIGLSSQICKVIPEDFAQEIEHSQIKEKFVKRPVDVLNAHMKASAHCPGIRRVIVQHAIYLMEFNSRYANDFHKCWMVEALSMIERTPSRSENYRLVSGDTGLMEHNTPLSTLVARAKELMGRYVFIRELTTMIHDDRYKCIAASLLWNMCEHAQPELSNSDLKELSYILREVLEGIMDVEGAELEVLIGLSSQICQVIPEDFTREVEHGQIKEKLVKRLVDVFNAHMKPSAHCPSIRRVIVQHAIYLMEFNSRYANDFHKCWMVEALSMVERTPSRSENYRLFSGDTGLMEHNAPLSALVARAKELMGREWKQIRHVTIAVDMASSRAPGFEW
uniref:BLE2 protein n=1 Tax=Oryza rufipogon TaxID=4529 RepID=A0A0E0QC22_ORYRU